MRKFQKFGYKFKKISNICNKTEIKLSELFIFEIILSIILQNNT